MSRKALRGSASRKWLKPRMATTVPESSIRRDLLLQHPGDDLAELRRLEVEGLLGYCPIPVGAPTRCASVVGRVGGDDGVPADHVVLSAPARVDHIAQIGRGEGRQMPQSEGSGSLVGLVAVALRQHRSHSFGVQSDPVVAAEQNPCIGGLQDRQDPTDRVLLVQGEVTFALLPLLIRFVE